jgi:uncharacterized protein
MVFTAYDPWRNSNFYSLIEEVKSKSIDLPPCHDWLHIKRVWNNAIKIAQEYQESNLDVIFTSVLVHDLIDKKFYQGSDEDASKLVSQLLASTSLTDQEKLSVWEIIDQMSYSKTLNKVDHHAFSLEYKIVRDADRLDAIGAVGVARAFSFGATRGNRFYDVEKDGFKILHSSDYLSRNSTTLQHFYDKLIELHKTMLTPEGMAMAKQRTEFLRIFINQIESEIAI